MLVLLPRVVVLTLGNSFGNGLGVGINLLSLYFDLGVVGLVG